MKLIFKKRPFLKQTLVVFMLFIVSNCYSQIRYERFVSSGFDTLEVNKLFIKAQFDSTVTYSDIKGPLNSITQLNGFDSLDAEIDTLSNTYLLNIDPGLTNLQFKQLLIFIRDSVAGVTSASEVYGTNASITGSDYFVVKLNSQSDSTILFAFATANLCTITGRNPMDSSQYYLKVDYDTGRNNLKLAYIFNDTNLFAYADAVLYFNVAPTDPTDDPMFGSQWWLRNTVTNNSFTLTSNTSYDIDADGAWAETTGCQFIRIAILDDGLIFNHPDINLSMNGYSVLWTDPTYVAGRDYTTSNNGNSYPEPNSKNVLGHGTKCAGVACALDNSIGGTGISPDTKVFAIKVYGKYKGGFTNLILANAYRRAADANADVISGSFAKMGSFGFMGKLVEDAIDYATTNGRDGLGSLIVHSSGNGSEGECTNPLNMKNDIVLYPAKHEKCVAVTGTNLYDQLKTCNDMSSALPRNYFAVSAPYNIMYNSSPGNNYYYQVDFPASHGDGVDIAAPCVDVLTTDLLSTNGFSATDYTFFNGTSAACPMAAGVASLIFSVNPLLDWERARKCLETTCDKVGGYTYNSGVSGQPNGTWSFELGYGRINANSAVQAALTATFPLTTVVNSVRNKWATGTYTVDANDAITIEAIIFDNYFTMTTANWYRNGSLIANNTKTISADKPGEYELQIVNPCSGKILYSDKITIKYDCSNYTTLTNYTYSGPPVTVTNQTYIIDGTLTIDTDVDFDNCKLVFTSCSRINVLNGNSLTFDDCILTSCSEWRGIRIINGSTPSKVLVLNNTQITYAQIGIYTVGDVAINIDNSEFGKNSMHIESRNSTDPNSFACINTQFGKLNTTTSGCSWPSGAIIGANFITMANVLNISIGNSSFNSENILSGINYVGILFDACQNGAIVNNTFDGEFGYGVQIINTSIDVQVSGNRINNYYPIGTIYPIGYSYSQHGIYCDEAYEIYIFDNEIYGCDYGIEYYANNSHSPESEVHNNYLYGNVQGLAVSPDFNPLNVILGSNSSTNQIDVLIYCNSFGFNEKAILGSGNLKVQGSNSPKLAYDNKFIGSTEWDWIWENSGTWTNVWTYNYAVNGTGPSYPTLNLNGNSISATQININTLTPLPAPTIHGGCSTISPLIAKPEVQSEVMNLTATLAPNPTLNDFKIKFSLPLTSTIKIVDAMGRLVYNEVVEGKEVIVDSQSWAKGVYFVLIPNGIKTINLRLIKL